MHQLCLNIPAEQADHFPRSSWIYVFSAGQTMTHTISLSPKVVFAAAKPRLCLAVSPFLLWCAQTAAQEPFLKDVTPGPRITRPRAEDNSLRFQKAEVWQGQQRVDVENPRPFVPAEILYGDPGSAQSATPRPPQQSTSVTNRIRSAAANSITPNSNTSNSDTSNSDTSTAGVAPFGGATAGVAKSGVVKSTAMSQTLAAHELLTTAKQFADAGDLATAQRLTDQARDLLAGSPSSKSSPRLESAVARLVEHWVTPAAPREPTPIASRTEVDAVTASSPLAVAALTRREPALLPTSVGTPRSSEVFRGTSKTAVNVAAEPAQANNSQADASAPNQYVVYNSAQPGKELTAPVPAVTVNFDMSNGRPRQYAADAGSWSAQTDQGAGSPHAAAIAASSPADSAPTLVLYFVGGLILGLGTLCGSLVVLAKLVAPRPGYQQMPYPVQATRPTPHGAELPESEFQSRPDVQSTHREARPLATGPVTSANAAISANAAGPASASRATGIVDRPTPAHHARGHKKSPTDEKQATGILEGIFQENLRLQGQMGLAAEVV